MRNSSKLIIVTPTYDRPPRLEYLKRIASALNKVPHLQWFVIEDDKQIDPCVCDFLKKSGLDYRYEAYGPSRHYGNNQRDYALQCIKRENLQGIVYLADDDNYFDPRLFEEIRKTRRFSLFPVGHLGPKGVERPVTVDGVVVDWDAGWKTRKYPVDTAAFAFNAEVLKEKEGRLWPNLKFGGETEFVEQFVARKEDFEVLCHQAKRCYVWHNQPLNESPGVTDRRNRWDRFLKRVFTNVPFFIFKVLRPAFKESKYQRGWIRSRRIQKFIFHKSMAKAFAHNLDLNRKLSKNFYLVLGCQSSGTTLLYLMLSSHPGFSGLDETDVDFFYFPLWPVLGLNRIFGTKTLYKLPIKVAELKTIQDYYPNASILWIIRSPYAAIASMKSLIINEHTNWIQKYARAELRNLIPYFPEIKKQIDIENLEEIDLAAYVWRYKTQMVYFYEKAGLKVSRIYYEELLKDPKMILEGALRFCGFGWNSAVLEHEKYHIGEILPGANKAEDPRDPNNDKKILNLSESEKVRIRKICGPVMEMFGYA